MSMIQLADKLNCTGCASCYQSCPHSAISMIPDEEGFLQPVIDNNKCVECGLCIKKCPVLTPVSKSIENQTAYALINYKERTISSSGGAFSAFAHYVIDNGGVVFGATMDNKFQVKHIAIEDENSLSLLRGSKYIQSNIGDCYKQAKTFLQDGRLVLFTGTPCQIAGLYAFLGNKRYEDKLITIDLVCHGVPSQGAFDAYIEKLKSMPSLRGQNITDFRFRNFDSWDYRPAVKLMSSKWKILSLIENAYMSAFFQGLTFRESCFRCKYCSTQRVGTFTIADFWGIGRHGKKFKKNVSCGVSLVIDNRNKMEIFSNAFKDNIYIEKRSIQEAIAEQSNLKKPIERKKQRDVAVKALISNDIPLDKFLQICGLQYNEDWKYKIKSLIKNIIYALGIYNVYKTIKYKLEK